MTSMSNISTQGFPQRCSDLFSSNFLLLSRASLISQNRWNHNRPPLTSLFSLSLLYISLCSESQPAPGTPVRVCSCMCVCVLVSFCAEMFWCSVCVCGVWLLACMQGMKYSGDRQALLSWKSLSSAFFPHSSPLLSAAGALHAITLAGISVQISPSVSLHILLLFPAASSLK